MQDQQWESVWTLFNSLSEMPAAQRTAVLESDTIDPEIRDEVLALLEASQSCAVQRSFSAPRAPVPELPVGSEFGRYKIVGLIGQGGFGRIYAAHDPELRRVVALKILGGPLLDYRARLIE